MKHSSSVISLETEIRSLEVFSCSFKRRGAPRCSAFMGWPIILHGSAFLVPQGPPLHLRHIMFCKHLDSCVLSSSRSYATDVVDGATMTSSARKAGQLSFFGTARLKVWLFIGSMTYLTG